MFKFHVMLNFHLDLNGFLFPCDSRPRILEVWSHREEGAGHGSIRIASSQGPRSYLWVLRRKTVTGWRKERLNVRELLPLKVDAIVYYLNYDSSSALFTTKTMCMKAIRNHPIKIHLPYVIQSLSGLCFARNLKYLTVFSWKARLLSFLEIGFLADVAATTWRL